jgi:hypothetical protein
MGSILALCPYSFSIGAKSQNFLQFIRSGAVHECAGVKL